MDLHRHLIESSPDAILVVDGDRVLFANPAAVALIGNASVDHLLASNVFHVFGPDYHQALRAVLDSCRAGKVATPIDVQVTGSGGHTVDVNVAGARLPGDPPAGVQLVLRDVSERKKTERALRESEERLSLAVAGALEGVWDWNLETNAVVYSSRWTEMLGYSRDEIEPHVSAWERLLSPRDSAARSRPRY